MYDLARVIMEEMKSSEKRTVTVELLTQSLGDKKFGFLNCTSFPPPTP